MKIIQDSGAGRKRPESDVRELRTRPPMARMQAIHSLLAAKKYPNAKTLAREFEVSDKTIRRDLEYMRDQLGLPVQYAGEKRGFYYDGEVANFPMVQITEGELLALLVARQAVVAYEGTPYAHLLSVAFSKLQAALKDKVSFSPDGLPEAISFRMDGAGKVDEAVFLAASKAVLWRTEVTFDYRKPGEAAEARRVQPYHLACIRGLWYLVGHDLDRQAMRTFALPRVSRFKPTRHRFARDPGFSPERYFGDSFGMLRGEGARRVRIAFDAYASELVRERFWHASQVFREKPGGEMELELRVSHFDEVKRWVLSWGGSARVLEPRELVEDLRKTARVMAAAHEGSPKKSS